MAKSKKILVVGGTGYIGSHMVDMLIKNGYKVTVIDKSSNPFIESLPNVELFKFNIKDIEKLREVFSKNSFECVYHFASSISVNESAHNPQLYYENNVTYSLNLLKVMLEFNVNRFIFSSTAAVYGEPKEVPIPVDHPKQPINPYGHSKLVLEDIISNYSKAYGLKAIFLRYFNAAGAHPEGLWGENHDPEEHLIPILLQTALGQRKVFTINGDNFDTKDGTCVRDFVHIVDICKAHLTAMGKLDSFTNNETRAYNLGCGNGFSILEVLTKAKEITKIDIPTKFGPSRKHDPAVLIADYSKTFLELGWKPTYSIDQMIEHAWSWEQKKQKYINYCTNAS